MNQQLELNGNIKGIVVKGKGLLELKVQVLVDDADVSDIYALFDERIKVTLEHLYQQQELPMDEAQEGHQDAPGQTRMFEPYDEEENVHTIHVIADQALTGPQPVATAAEEE